MTHSLLALLLACSASSSEAPAPATSPGQEASPVQAAAADTGQEQPLVGDVSEGDQAVHTDQRLAARHILVSYEGAQGAPKSLTRSRAEALERARALHARLLAGEDFSALARAESDDPSASMGGMLGSFEPGTMVPLFEQPLVRLDEGELSEPVETPFGFHLIERLPLLEYRLAHVLVQWQGRRNDKSGRTQEEARLRIEEARAALQAGTPADQVARTFSDGPSAAWGGELGWMQKGQMVQTFDEAAFALGVGEHSEIIETSLGYHLVIRLE